MIAMDCPRKIEEFYEAYKDVRTPLGSAYLVQFYTMKQPALMFGPDKNGDFLYFWLSKDGNIGYLGYSFMTSMIKGKYNDPVFPDSFRFRAGQRDGTVVLPAALR